MMTALIGAVVGWFAGKILGSSQSSAAGIFVAGVYGAPLGAIPGAIAAVVYLRRRRRAETTSR
jgi:uncharacterized membrane protein